MMEIKQCPCGGTPEFVKLHDRLRYDGFMKCPRCGYEGRVYVSKQGAVKAWNRVVETTNRLHKEIEQLCYEMLYKPPVTLPRTEEYEAEHETITATYREPDENGDVVIDVIRKFKNPIHTIEITGTFGSKE